MEKATAEKKVRRSAAGDSQNSGIDTQSRPKGIKNSSLCPEISGIYGLYPSMGDQSSVIDFSNARYAIGHLTQRKQRYLDLQRIMIEAKEEYLNLKRTNTSENNGSITGKNLDRSNVLNDTNILQHLFCDISKVYVNTLTPSVREQIICRFQRCEVLERYLNIDEGCSPETKDVEDKTLYDVINVLWPKPPGTHAAFVSTEGKKYKTGFKEICGHFLSSCNFPEGLLLAQSLFSAKTALEFYNDKHGTDYKLVEPLSSCRYLGVMGLHFHCNFTASKVKKNGSRTRPKLFFASFLLIKKKICDIRCYIIDPTEAYFMCCEYCPPDLAHAARGRNHYTLLSMYLGRVKEFYALRNRLYAELALDMFNKKHGDGTLYKLVKPLEINILPVRFGVYTFHCNFKAKLEKPGSSDNAPRKKKFLFFADIVKSTLSTEGDCCILENTEDLDDHCSICRQGQGVLHPAHYRIPAISND